MDKKTISQLTKFNSLYLEFVGQLKTTFPKLTKHLPNYSNYLPFDYIKDFVKYNLPFMDELSVGNLDIFTLKYTKTNLINGLAFKRIITRSPLALKEAILKYLRDLYKIGHETNLFVKISASIEDEHSIARKTVIENHSAILANLMKLGEEPEEPEELETEEPEEEGLLESLLGGAGNPLAAMLGGGAGNPLAAMLGGGADNPLAAMLGGGDNPLPDLLGNSQIGGLVKEIYDGMGADELEQLGNLGREGLGNPAALMAQLIGVARGDDNNNPINNIVQRTVTNIEQKMANGEINLEHLMTDVQGFLGALDPNNTFSMPAGTPQSETQEGTPQSETQGAETPQSETQVEPETNTEELSQEK